MACETFGDAGAVLKREFWQCFTCLLAMVKLQNKQCLNANFLGKICLKIIYFLIKFYEK